MTAPTRAGPLRLGVLASGTTVAAWQHRALTDLVAGGDVELVVLVVDTGGGAVVDRGPRRLWRLYNNRWVARRSHAVARVDARDLLGGLDRLDVTVERAGKFEQRFPDDTVASLRALDLDVLLRFGFGILRGEVLDVARYGVWSFHHDDERIVRGGPPSFWEVHDGMATTGVLFQRLTDRLDGGVPLARATFRTVSHSYPRNRDRAAFGAAGLPAQVARAVRAGHLDPDAPPTTSDAAVRRDPTDRQMLGHLSRHTARVVRHHLRSLTVGARWAIAVASESDDGQTGGWTWIPERRGGYDADPFAARRHGVTAMLVEEFDEKSNRGVISALVRNGGRWERRSGVFDPGVHASYPFLVEDGDELYCVPETARLGRVEAWRCRTFPTEWDRAGTLVDAPVVDPTIVRHGGRWWLFGGRRDRDANTELWLWSADALLGPWTPHPQNPVKIDVTSSRPAGTPFRRDGVLYRPAQDCSTGYGTAIVVNEVLVLDEDRFEERVTERRQAPPGAYGAGSHTWSSGGGLVAVDAKRATVDLHRSWRELRARLVRR